MVCQWYWCAIGSDVSGIGGPVVLVSVVLVGQWERCASGSGVPVAVVCQWCVSASGVPVVVVCQWERCARSGRGVSVVLMCRWYW